MPIPHWPIRCLPLLLSVVLGINSLCGQGIRRFHYQHTFQQQHSFYLNDTLPNPVKKRWVTGIALGGYATGLIYLGSAWYANEDLSSFHFFDDSGQWKQIDKAGHMLGAYHGSRYMIDLYKWSGVPKKQALISGGLAGFLAMSSIELFDAFGESWGFSWSDIAANFTGSSLAVGNQWLWNENRIQLKFSWHPSPYASVDSLQYLFGSNTLEHLVKDYNGQTYWLSFRVHSFLPEGSFRRAYPRWLNLAFGYGAEGMTGGYGQDPQPEIRAREYRQYYLALDIDLSNIRTRSGFLNTLFSAVSVIRIPSPALRFDRNGVKFLPLE